MNTDKIYAEHIVNEYSKKKESKVVALKKLDKKAKRPTEIFAYTNGIIIGIIGMIGIGINYPLYKKYLNHLKKSILIISLG